MPPLNGVTEIANRTLVDERGELKVVQFDSKFPFVPQRIFTISNVLNGEERGGHAHRQCHQVIMVVAGEVDLALTDGTDNLELRVDRKSRLFWVKPGIWVKMSKFTEECVILVFASDFYDEGDYIHSHTELKAFNSLGGEA